MEALLRAAMRKIVFLARAVRNAVRDLRYGRPVIGSERTRFAAQGSADVVNSDWGALRVIFADRVRPDDVIVDVGCGRGRVLNFCLSRFPNHRLVGIELDPEIARRTALRLRKHHNVEIRSGDAVRQLPGEGSLFFLFNPFDATVLRRLVERLEEPSRPRGLRVLYYNPKHLGEFERSGRWRIHELSIGGGRWAPYSKLGVIEKIPGDEGGRR